MSSLSTADPKEAVISATESLSNGRSVVYTYRRGSNDIKAVDIKNRTYHLILAPHPVESVVSLLSVDCCLCQNGSIYKIPSNCEGISRRSIDEEVASKVGREWTQAEIGQGDFLMAEKRCRAVCGFDDFLALVIGDDEFHVINVYRLEKTASQSTGFRLMATVSLPSKRSVIDRFSIDAFQSAIGPHDDRKLNPMVFQSLFGDREVQTLKSWAILASGEHGEIFYALFSDKTKCDSVAVPLFCLHQPVVKMQKFLANDKVSGPSDDREGLLVVGSLGKLTIITITLAEKDKPTVFDLYLPGPIRFWAGWEHTGIYSDGIIVWKSELIQKGEDEEKFELKTDKITRLNVIVKGAHCYSFQNKLHLLLCFDNGSFEIVQDFDRLAGNDKAMAESADIKGILTSIHDCSAHLNKVCETEANLKACLNELACAAYLTLNDRGWCEEHLKSTRLNAESAHTYWHNPVQRKVSTKLNSSVLAEWTSADPHNCKLSIKLQNSSNFAIIGNHWHFVITLSSASGHHFTKSSPLKDGLPLQESATVCFTVDCRNNELPFKITTGLKFFLEFSESVGNNKTVAAFVHLAHLSVDEFSFVSPNGTSCCTANSLIDVNCALMEIAKQKSGFGSHNLSPFLHQIASKTDKSVTGFASIDCEYARKVLKRQSFALLEIPLCQQILRYLLKDCAVEIELPANCALELSLFDDKFRLSVEEIEQFLEIKLVVYNALMLPKLRSAIIRRLQLPILKECAKDAHSLSEEKQHLLFSRIYQDIRKDISSRFHFI